MLHLYINLWPDVWLFHKDKFLVVRFLYWGVQTVLRIFILDLGKCMNTWREILLMLSMQFKAWHFLLSHCIMGKYHFDDFWCKQLMHSSDLRKKAFRIWKGTRTEYTLKVKVASQLLTWQWLLWLLLLSQERKASSLFSYLIHNLTGLEKHCRRDSLLG